MFRTWSGLVGVWLGVGCGAMNTARPLEQGKHAIGATFGGLMITQFGPPVPLPFLVVEGKSGLKPIGDRPLEINYGINATALAFGTVGLQVGAAHLLLRQDGWRPSLSVLERVHLYNNYLDTTKDTEVRAAFLLNQIDVTAAWDVQRHLAYAGVGNYLDVVDPELNISPFAGFEYRGNKRAYAQLEFRYFAANRAQDVSDVSVFGANRGGLSSTVSVGWKLGGVQ